MESSNFCSLKLEFIWRTEEINCQGCVIFLFYDSCSGNPNGVTSLHGVLSGYLGLKNMEIWNGTGEERVRKVHCSSLLVFHNLLYQFLDLQETNFSIEKQNAYTAVATSSLRGEDIRVL